MRQHFFTWLEIFMMLGMGLIWLGGVGYITLKLTGLL